MNTTLSVAGLAVLLFGGYYAYARLKAYKSHIKQNEAFLKKEFAGSGVALASTNALLPGRKEMPGMLVLLPSRLVYITPDRNDRKEYPLSSLGPIEHAPGPVPTLTIHAGSDAISFILPDAGRWAEAIAEAAKSNDAKTSTDT